MDLEILRNCLKKLGKEEWVLKLETLENTVNEDLRNSEGEQKFTAGKVKTCRNYTRKNCIFFLKYLFSGHAFQFQDII